MSFHTLAGNAPLKRQLSAQMQGRGLSHAYLISGPAGSGKHTLARLMAAAMVCTGEGERPCGVCSACKKALQGIHPDIITAGEGDKPISVGQARLLRSDAYIRPNEAPRKVYILPNAQEMNPSAQNALLKLLEEGPVYAAFLLLAENSGSGWWSSPWPLSLLRRRRSISFPGSLSCPPPGSGRRQRTAEEYWAGL